MNIGVENTHGVLVFNKDNFLVYFNPVAEALLPQPLTVGESAQSLPECGAVFEGLLEDLRIPGQTSCRMLQFNRLSTNKTQRIRILGLCLPQQNSLVLEEIDSDSAASFKCKEIEARNAVLEKRNTELESAWEELAAELEMARQIQESILPHSLPSAAGFEFAVEYLPSGKVGGDFYNVMHFDADHLLVLEADVSGHGIPAAFMTTIAKTLFDRNMRPNSTLSQNLRRMNEDLCDHIKTEHYLTAFLTVLNIRNGSMRYCRICHPYPIIFRKATGEIEYLKSRGGFFLGMMKEENEFEEQETSLQPGDKILIYTDGLNEAFNAENSQYGRDRLAASVQKHGNLPTQDFLKKIMDDRASFMKGQPNSDDITALAVGRMG